MTIQRIISNERKERSVERFFIIYTKYDGKGKVSFINTPTAHRTYNEALTEAKAFVEFGTAPRRGEQEFTQITYDILKVSAIELYAVPVTSEPMEDF